MLGLACALSLASVHAQSPIETRILEPAAYCRLSPNTVIAHYPVVYSFTNREAKTTKLALWTDHELIYEMYRNEAGMKARDFVLMNNPDYFGDAPLPTETHRVKPGETLQWKGTAPVFLIDGSEPVTKPGLYYVLPFPSVVLNGKHSAEPDDGKVERLIPLTIVAPPEAMEYCPGVSKKDRKLMDENKVPLGRH
jgi:hypothetical protein